MFLTWRKAVKDSHSLLARVATNGAYSEGQNIVVLVLTVVCYAYDRYWWELVILARKVVLVVVSMFNTTHVERGWWVMSLIQLTAICAQLLVMPYRDYVTNMYDLMPPNCVSCVGAV